MELINAEYSWNTKSSGFYKIPLTNKEGVNLWRRYMNQENEPEEIFGNGKLYEQVCRRLYGEKAGLIMMQYYRESAWLPEEDAEDIESEGRYYYSRPITYLPDTWDRAYAIPFHWRHILQDSSTWGTEIQDERYKAAAKRLNLDRREIHRRLARRWQIAAELNSRGQNYIERALGADPVPDSVEDLRFLRTLLIAYQPLIEALEQFHGVLYLRSSESSSNDEMRRQLETALHRAEQARDFALETFPNRVDPVAGEVGTVVEYSGLLTKAIQRTLSELGGE